jgi:predicted ATPase
MQQGEVPVQGAVRKEAVRLRLGFIDDEFGYSISFGLPVPSHTLFSLDPEIKHEAIWVGETPRPSALLVERRGAVLRVRRDEKLSIVTDSGDLFESLFSQLLDPSSAPEVGALRRRLRGWRFYDNLRTDREAPARMPQVGTRTAALHHDGRDLAAAWQTIREIGDGGRLDELVAGALAQSVVQISSQDDGRLMVQLQQPGILRALRAHELSEGTLRFLMLAAALLTPRPPSMMVLNEPEVSLHPELIPPLAQLIGEASEKMQIWVVTHNQALVSLLSKVEGSRQILLRKELGQTLAEVPDYDESTPWRWVE